MKTIIKDNFDLNMYKFRFKTNTGNLVEFCSSGATKEKALLKIYNAVPHIFEYTNKDPFYERELISYKNSSKRPANFVG
jgi:hypothetical protein